MMPYNQDYAFERLKDAQREMENSRIWADRTVDVLGLFAQPLIALVEALIAAVRPAPAGTTAVDEPETWRRIAS